MFVSGLPVAGVMFAFRESNWSGKGIVVLLFIGSIFVWSIMAAKAKELLAAKTQSTDFLDAYRRQKHPSAIFASQRQYPSSPLYAVYHSTCGVLRRELKSVATGKDGVKVGVGSSASVSVDAAGLKAVSNMAERTVADQALLLESGMGLLATTTSTAPFLGLLGTVWGVMDSFSGMAMSGSAMLSAVAPGISGALLTTVVGLLVALPSSIGYNFLTGRIRRLVVQTDNFAQELVLDVERYHSISEGRNG